MALSISEWIAMTIALGDVLYGDGAGSIAKLAGNTTSTKKFLSQTGNGSVSAAPTWETMIAGDLPATVFLKDSDQTLSEGTDIAVGTSTGTKIGTATSQKLGFFNATPVVQQTVTTDLLDALQALGFIASGAGDTPLDLSSGAFACGAATIGADSSLAEGVDIAVGTSTGSKIGTATSQKLGFFNSTPIVQPIATTDLLTALVNLGFIASGTTPLTLPGIFTPTSGIAAAGGFSVSARTYHTGGIPARVNSDGSDATPSVSEVYFAEVRVDENCTVTGVSVFLGSATEGNIKVGLADSTGAVVATSASTDCSGATVDAYFRVAFTAPYAAKGPATYYVLLFNDNTGNRFNAHTFGDFVAGKQTGQTYATGFTTITPGTTFTTALGPIASLYSV